jgi:hypothetical protein
VLFGEEQVLVEEVGEAAGDRDFEQNFGFYLAYVRGEASFGVGGLVVGEGNIDNGCFKGTAEDQSVIGALGEEPVKSVFLLVN